MLDEIDPDLVFISPGPGYPEEQNVPQLVGEALKRKIPVLVFVWDTKGLQNILAGNYIPLSIQFTESLQNFHNEKSFFKGLPNPFSAGRYHSLYVDRDTLPKCFDISATTEDGVIMGFSIKRFL